MQLTQQQPTAIQEAMLQTLRAGRWSGYIKPDIDLPHLGRPYLSDHAAGWALDVMRHKRFLPTRWPALALARIILQGFGDPGRPPMRHWIGPRHFAAARRGHRDVGPTTTTGISATRRPMVRCGGTKGVRPQGLRGHHHQGYRVLPAGLGTGTVYRVIGSKDELLDSVMRSFGKKVEAGLGQRAALGGEPNREVWTH